MFGALIRPAMIFVPFLLGIMFPGAHVLAGEPFNVIAWCLMTMVFLSCLQLRFSQLKPHREHWLLLGVNLLMGVAPYLTLKFAFPERPELALAAFFVGITPTATAAPVVVAFLHGRVGFALTGFTISNVFISLALLALLPLVFGDCSAGFAAGVAWTLARLMAMPFAAALIVRWVWPGARDLPGRSRTFSFLLWSFTLFVLAASARQYFIDHPGEPLSRIAPVALISLVICAINFALGRILSRRRYSRESSQLLGQKNTTFTMYLALHYAGALAAMGPIFYILWHNCWNAFQMYRYDSRRRRKRQRLRAEI